MQSYLNETPRDVNIRILFLISDGSCERSLAFGFCCSAAFSSSLDVSARRVLLLAADASEPEFSDSESFPERIADLYAEAIVEHEGCGD